MSRLFKHYSEYTGPWPWSNFTPREVSCRHCGELFLDMPECAGKYASPALDALQRLRAIWGRPIILNSAHRCAEHNAAVGGAARSRHLGLAFDCRCHEAEQEAFCNAAEQAGFTGLGRYPERGFVHLDLGPERAWRG